MPKRKRHIKHDAIVDLFAARLRELRATAGMTQAELARQAQVTVSYIWKLESAGAAPGIDLVARLATALGTSAADLLPSAPGDPLPTLRDQADRLFQGLVRTGSRETFIVLNPFLARLAETERNR
jgi:transcriptional regulator with XRE-family HTH domain